jgi:hypothetical protein
MSDFLQAAIELADMGYRVFPCQAGTNIPMAGSHGCLDATRDQNQIEEWWEKHPNANVAVSTDGLCVVDVDPIEEGDARRENLFAQEHNRLEDLLVSAGASTPRGGQHFWFKQVAGQDIRNSTSRVAQGVDIRANGGYVMVPPSTRPDGKYEWLWGWELECSPELLAPVPLWLLKLIEQPKELACRDDAGNLVPIGKGGRNQTLASLAGALRRIGIDQKAIEFTLQETNQQRCNPPLSRKEVAKIAESVSRYEVDQVAQSVAENWHEADRQASRKRQVKSPGAMPSDLLSPGGFLGDVIDWNLRTAFKPQRELALASALSLMATLTGRKITDERGTRTNLYCLGVCETGGGKEHGRKVNKAILTACGGEDFIGPEGIGSHVGLLSSLQHNPVQLFQIDEIGRLLATLNNPSKAPHLYNVVSVLLKLYTSSDSFYIGDAVADRKKIARIQQPHAVVYGTTVPENFFQSLAKESLSDGFVSRLLVFDAENGDPDSQESIREHCPEEIVEVAGWWRSFSPGGNLSGHNPQPKTIPLSESGRREINQFDLAAKAEGRAGNETSKLWTRAVEKARKLALIHAVSLDKEADSVGAESVEWACWVVHHLTAKLEYLATDWIAENQTEAYSKRLLRIIKSHGEHGITLSQIYRQSQWISQRQRSELLDNLEGAGEVYKEAQETAGRPRLVYKIAQ